MSSYVDFHLTALPGCSFYLTPTWSLPTCEVICKPGFLDTNPTSNWLSPSCARCASSCPIGKDLPVCRGGTSGGAASLECVSCLPASKGSQSHWVVGPGCPWQCNNGYYRESGQCRQCVVASCTPDAIFLGCTAESPGQCLNWVTSSYVCADTILVTAFGDTNEYLEYFIWSTACSKKSCSQPVIGTTFIKTKCSRFADAILNNCSSTCSTGSFSVGQCGAYENLQCRACSVPSVLGLMLMVPCGGATDAVFGLCSTGRGCDANGIAYNCTLPRIAVNGTCVCPSAMVDSGGGACAVRACADGTYPDPSTGTCLVCSTSSSSLTVSGVLGPNACACAPGYFMSVGASPDNIVCWACGNLMCGNEQAQSSCFGGRSTRTPSCDCNFD